MDINVLNISNTEAELQKSVAYKEQRVVWTTSYVKSKALIYSNIYD